MADYTHIVWLYGRGGDTSLNHPRDVKQALGGKDDFENRSWLESPNGGLVSIYTTEENAVILAAKGFNINKREEIDKD